VPDTTPERLTRVVVPELEDILGNPVKVLDDGFVRVVDYMGSDVSIVQAARVSYGKGTKRVREDRALIRYLMRHRHTTPFEMCEIKLHVRAPMDCWRQWIRHRTANVNEYSTRYSIAIDSAKRTKSTEWRLQAHSSRQGSEGLLAEHTGATLTVEEEELQQQARAVYEKRLKCGVAREQARKDLPLSTYTEAYWKIDLHNLLNFLSLRMDDHAQSEIRAYATVIGPEFVKRWCPMAWEAFVDYRIHGLFLSRIEVELVQAIASGNLKAAQAALIGAGLLSKDGSARRKNRERAEFAKKLQRLGLPKPWA
jgi:thymidylate synthase (FAD)